MNKIFIKTLLIPAVLLASACSLTAPSQRGELREIFVKEGELFRIRILRYAENNGGFIAGAYYVFQSAPKNGEAWREVMQVHHDDPIDIPREQIYLVSDKVGYVFMKQKFAVTQNAGESWAVWDASEKMPDWKKAPTSINSVRINNQGEGIMELLKYSDSSSLALRTINFGITWQ